MMIMRYTSWSAVPDGLHTKTQLRRMGYRLVKDQPVHGYKVDRKRKQDYPLYKIDEAEKYEATAAQKAALEKARAAAERVNVLCARCGEYVTSVTRKRAAESAGVICERCGDANEASEWARAMLARPVGEVLILDTETTDLNGEIIEIAAIDTAGNVLLNQRMKPQGQIAAGAQAVHGITLEMLADAPDFEEVYPLLCEITRGKVVLIYNYSFDADRLQHDCARRGLMMPKWGKRSGCIMRQYAQWYGDWSNYWGDYKWQPLGGGDHSAVGDCRAALDALKQMAGVDDE